MTLKFNGATRAEDSAIRGWLERQGVEVGRDALELDEAKLDQSGVDKAKLQDLVGKSGDPDGITLEMLRAATLTASPHARQDLADTHTREFAELMLTNVISLGKSAKGELETSFPIAVVREP